MKSFIIKAILLILSIILIFQLSVHYIKQKQIQDLFQTIGAGTIEKHHRLATIATPKLILVGGSNVMFGFDSEMMENKLKMPVQNMALGAALGLSFILQEIKKDIKTGDKVLLSLEYFLGEGDYNTKLYIAELNPEAANYIKYDSKLDSFKINTNYALRKIRNYVLLDFFSKRKTVVEDEAYGRNAFTTRGDIRDKLRLSQKLPLQGGGTFNTDYSNEIEKINDFVTYVEQKKGKVFLSFPPTTEGEYQLKAQDFESFYQQLKSKGKFQIITKPKDSIYPESYFYDTVYHLRSPYQRIHTAKILTALETAILK